MKIDLKNLTIDKAKKAFESGEYTPAELYSAYKEQISKVNPEVNAYLEVFDSSEVAPSYQRGSTSLKPPL